MKLTLPADRAGRAQEALASRLPAGVLAPAPSPAPALHPKTLTALKRLKPATAKPQAEVTPVPPEPELTEAERAKRRHQAAELNAQYEARQRRIRGIAEVEAAARTLWPNAFTDPPTPLALGVDRAFMAERRWPVVICKTFLHRWLNRPAYLRAVADGVCRVNLAGEPTEPPEPSHRKHAAEKLAGRGPPAPIRPPH
jgi:hypothetical protein